MQMLAVRISRNREEIVGIALSTQMLVEQMPSYIFVGAALRRVCDQLIHQLLLDSGSRRTASMAFHEFRVQPIDGHAQPHGVTSKLAGYRGRQLGRLDRLCRIFEY